MKALYGRERELRILRDFIEAVAGSAGRALALVGEPGIGKTALLDAVRTQATGLRVLWTRAVESEAMIPFAVLGVLLHALMPRRGELPLSQAASLAAAVEVGAAQPVDALGVAAAAFNLLSLVAADEPLLLVVDDAQWIDAGSALALSFTAGRVSDQTLGLLLANRTGETPTTLDHVESVPVGGLSRAAARQLLADRTPCPFDSGVADELIEFTGGNPLALLEAPGLLSTAQLKGTEPLPRPLAPGEATLAAFRQQLAELPEPARRALVIVAAAESDPASIASALAALGIPGDALDAAEAARLVCRDGGRIVFRHPLIRSVAYHDAEPADRRSAHRALADEMGHAGLRGAWHLAEATTGPDEAAAAALEAAAGAPSSSFVEASIAYARAADLSVDRERRVGRLVRSAHAAMLGGRIDAAIALAERARDEAVEPLQRAQAQHILGQLASGWTDQPIAEAIALLEGEAELVAGRHPEQAATMLADAAFAANALGDLCRATRLATRAAELAEQSGDAARILETSLIVACNRVETGEDFVDVDHFVHHIGEIAIGQLGASQYGTLIDLTLVHLDEHDRFSETINERITQARAAAAIFPLAILLEVRCEGEWATGLWRLAEADAAEAIALVPERSLLTGFAFTAIARVHAARGKSEACRDAVSRALAVANQGDVAGIRHYTTFAAAEEALALGDFELAREAFERLATLQAAACVRNPTFLNWRPGLVECCMKLGDTRSAAREAAVLEEAAERLPIPTLRAYAADARARLAHDEDYEPLFEQALELHAQGGRRFMRARTLLAFGERLRRERRRREARAPLREAVVLFDELPAEPWAERARQELRATGETVRGRTDDARDSLTPIELQIARLIRQGQSNRDIAVSLFVSPKTVEKHITSIYRKLGVSSRRDLWDDALSIS